MIRTFYVAFVSWLLSYVAIQVIHACDFKSKNDTYTSRKHIPNAVDQRIHALVYKMSVGLPQTKALFFEHFGKAQKV